MKNKIPLFILSILILISISCATDSAESGGNEGTVLTETVYAANLAGNLLNIPNSQQITVYLPPEYDTTGASFPVVYYLHGYGGDYSELLYFCNKRTLDRFMNEDSSRQFILVGVNCYNNGDSFFYVNSEAAGNWETFIIEEVITYVDTNFRTIENADSRGISGFSMGGFGSIYYALRYPDIFSYLFSLSPGLFNSSGLEDAMATWDINIKRAYGVSFAPNTSNPPYYTSIPSGSDISNMTPAAQEWQNGFGDLDTKVSDYLAKTEKLKAIQLEYGLQDYYTWIRNGCEYMHTLLNTNNIEHTFEKFNGGHSDRVGGRLRDSMLPFFRENLIFTE